MAITVVKCGSKPEDIRPPADVRMRGRCEKCGTEVSCLGADASVVELGGMRPAVSVHVQCPVCDRVHPSFIRVQSNPPWRHPHGLPVNGAEAAGDDSVSRLLDELANHWVGEDCTHGTKDPVRLDQLRQLWQEAIGADGYRQKEAVWVRERFLSDRKIAAGYGAEDVYSFMKWMDRLLG